MTDINFLLVLIVNIQCGLEQLKRLIFDIEFVRKHYDNSSSFTLRNTRTHSKEM